LANLLGLQTNRPRPLLAFGRAINDVNITIRKSDQQALLEFHVIFILIFISTRPIKTVESP
jgi:hypothetical protein